MFIENQKTLQRSMRANLVINFLVKNNCAIKFFYGFDFSNVDEKLE